MKKILWLCIIFYIRYISIALPKSCRYYPTCSQYALWQLKYSGFSSSVIAIFLRILKCNQLFRGGIDYPIVKRKFAPNFIFLKRSRCKLIFWFVPYKKDKFYVIKVFDSLKET